jgi:hypothetical protein
MLTLKVRIKFELTKKQFKNPKLPESKQGPS